MRIRLSPSPIDTPSTNRLETAIHYADNALVSVVVHVLNSLRTWHHDAMLSVCNRDESDSSFPFSPAPTFFDQEPQSDQNIARAAETSLTRAPP